MQGLMMPDTSCKTATDKSLKFGTKSDRGKTKRKSICQTLVLTGIRARAECLLG